MRCWSRILETWVVLASSACGPEVVHDAAPRLLVEALVDGREQIWLFDATDDVTTRVDPPAGDSRSVCGIAPHAERFCIRGGPTSHEPVVLVHPGTAPIDATALHHGATPSSLAFFGDDVWIHGVGGRVFELDVHAGSLRVLLQPPMQGAWIWSEIRVSAAGTWVAAPVTVDAHRWDLLLARRSDGTARVVELGAESDPAIVQPQLPDFAADEQALFVVAGHEALVLGLDRDDLRTLALPDGPLVQRMSAQGDLVAWGVGGDVFVLSAIGGAPGDPRRITEGSVVAFELGPDGRWMLVETATAATLVEIGSGAAFGLGRRTADARFAADGTALLFADTHAWQLVDLAADPPRVAPIAARTIAEIELAPDGDAVALILGRTLSVVTREHETHEVTTTAAGLRPSAPRFSSDGAWLSWELVRGDADGSVAPVGVAIADWSHAGAPTEILGARRRLAVLD